MRVVVVGGGVIGLTSAYHLLKDGHEVTLVDAGAFGAGASHGNAGYVVPSDAAPVPAPGMVLKALRWMLHRDSPLYVRPSLRPDVARFMLAMASRCNTVDFDAAFRANLLLCEHAMELLDAYAADGVRFEMHRQGYLSVYADEHGLAHRVADLATPTEYGMEPEVLTGRELTEREPALLPSLAGGVYFPHDRHLRPDTLMTGLVDRCAELGVKLVDHAAVIRIRGDTRVRAVETTTGVVEGEEFLLAAGAHTTPLARSIGVRLPIRPGKGYSLDYLPAPVQVSCSINLADAKVAVTPLDGRLRLAGTMEFAGLDHEVNPLRVRAIQAAPSRYFAGWQPGSVEHTEPWAGIRPMTPDGLPVIGRLPGWDNAWVAAGHGMLGVTLGPATGQGIAEAIGSGHVPERLAPFTPTRFLSRSGRPRMRPRPTTPT